MNAKKNMKTLIAAGLCAVMMTAPCSMLAAETSAHVPNSVEAQQGEREQQLAASGEVGRLDAQYPPAYAHGR